MATGRMSGGGHPPPYHPPPYPHPHPSLCRLKGFQVDIERKFVVAAFLAAREKNLGVGPWVTHTPTTNA